MRLAAVLVCILATAYAAPKYLHCVRDAETAIKIARTRGKLIFLTVLVDNDSENRAVVDDLFRDPAFLKLSKEFVCLYANKDDEHGKVKLRLKNGKQVLRCADVPSITCEDHMVLAMNFARGFFPGSLARTPVHFVIDADQEIVATIKNGTFEQGFNHVPAKRVVSALKRLLDKHGRGLTEEEYKHMLALWSDAKAAHARSNVTLELKKLLEIVALDRKVEGVQKAREKVKRIDTLAAKELAKTEPLVEAGEWEEALDALQKVRETYPGTPTAAKAKQRRDKLQDRKEVKRLLKARDYYDRAQHYKSLEKLDLARKYFERLVRKYGDTKYGELARKELEAFGER